MRHASIRPSCRAPAVPVAILALSIAVACHDDTATPRRCTIERVPDQILLEVGGGIVSLPLTAACTDNQRARLRWTSSDSGVAVVDALTGDVRARAPGLASLTATVDGGAAAPVSVAVSVSACRGVATRLSITPPSLVMPILGTAQLSARTDYSCGRPSDTTAVWRSSDTTIATVTVSGVLKGVRAGAVSISAASTSNPSLVASIPLTVTPPGAISAPPVVSTTFLQLPPGATSRLTVHVPIAPTAPPGTDTSVSFRSADSCTATVAADGSVTAHDLGSTWIEVAARGDTLLRTSVAVLAFYRGAIVAFDPITSGTPPVAVDPGAVRGTIDVTVHLIAAPPAGGRLDISLGGRLAATRELPPGTLGSGPAVASFTVPTDARDPGGARLYPNGPTAIQALFTHNPPASRLAGCPVRVAGDANTMNVTLANP